MGERVGERSVELTFFLHKVHASRASSSTSLRAVTALLLPTLHLPAPLPLASPARQLRPGSCGGSGCSKVGGSEAGVPVHDVEVGAQQRVGEERVVEARWQPRSRHLVKKEGKKASGETERRSGKRRETGVSDSGARELEKRARERVEWVLERVQSGKAVSVAEESESER